MRQLSRLYFFGSSLLGFQMLNFFSGRLSSCQLYVSRGILFCREGDFLLNS